MSPSLYVHERTEYVKLLAGDRTIPNEITLHSKDVIISSLEFYKSLGHFDRKLSIMKSIRRISENFSSFVNTQPQ
jgi:hypothetical protein